MERRYPVIQFETVVGEDGRIVLPKNLREKFRAGEEITVKITAGIVSKKLHRRFITEDLIEQIALTQLEQREQVMSFLEGEGALQKNLSFKKRAEKYVRRKR